MFPLYLATYTRGTYPVTGKTKPCHWLFFIDQGQEVRIMHQLRGMPGSFRYSGPESLPLSSQLGSQDGEELQMAPGSGSLKEKLEIGEVDSNMLPKVHEIFKSVCIDTIESSGWNCQDCSLDAFEKLRQGGFAYDYLTQEVVKNWLKEDA